MNPSLKLLLLCLLTIEITIMPNLIANLCLIIGSLILLICLLYTSDAADDIALV